MDLKGDLGALVLGVLISSHTKSKSLAKALFSTKKLMLIGFFLSVGMQGLPNWTIFTTALGLVVLLPFKTFLYFLIAKQFGLRLLTSLFNAISPGNYSEFGLIITALRVSQGFLSVEWLLVFAIAVSLSFAAAASFSKCSDQTYQKFKNGLSEFPMSKLHKKPNPRYGASNNSYYRDGTCWN